MAEIAFPLGGGGVKWFAHFGFLKVLEKKGFKIDAITGTVLKVSSVQFMPPKAA